MNTVSLLEYGLLAFSSLFVIVDPVATAPAFLVMTRDDTTQSRIRMARLASIVLAAVLIVFSFAGKWIFKFLGITMPAFQLAASIILILVALDMLRAQRSRVQETREETDAGTEKTDVAIAPLAIPMLAGPGAISTAILLHNQAVNVYQHIILYAVILIVSFATFLILSFAAKTSGRLSPIALNITTRIMGLLLAALAVQFMLDAVRDLNPDWIRIAQ